MLAAPYIKTLSWESFKFLLAAIVVAVPLLAGPGIILAERFIEQTMDTKLQLLELKSEEQTVHITDNNKSIIRQTETLRALEKAIDKQDATLNLILQAIQNRR